MAAAPSCTISIYQDILIVSAQIKILTGIAGKTSTRCPPSLPVHDDVLLLVAHLHPVRDELQLLEDALQKFVIVRSEGQQCQI